MSQTIVYTECFLTVKATQRGQWFDIGLPRIAKKKPTLAPSEVCINLKIELPVTLFKRPQIEAHVKVPEDSVVPPVVSMEIVDNIREIASGLELTISVPESN